MPLLCKTFTARGCNVLPEYRAPTRDAVTKLTPPYSCFHFISAPPSVSMALAPTVGIEGNICCFTAAPHVEIGGVFGRLVERGCVAVRSRLYCRRREGRGATDSLVDGALDLSQSRGREKHPAVIGVDRSNRGFPPGGDMFLAEIVPPGGKAR